MRNEPPDPAIIHAKAEAIVEIIMATNTDHRHLVYAEASEILRNRAQGFTGRLFHWMAEIDQKGEVG